jgi:hypothetical protein
LVIGFSILMTLLVLIIILLIVVILKIKKNNIKPILKDFSQNVSHLNFEVVTPPRSPKSPHFPFHFTCPDFKQKLIEFNE